MYTLTDQQYQVRESRRRKSRGKSRSTPTWQRNMAAMVAYSIIFLVVVGAITLLPAIQNKLVLDNIERSMDMPHIVQQQQVRRETTTYMYVYVANLIPVSLGLLIILGFVYVVAKIQAPTYRLKDGAYPILTRMIGGTWNIVDPNKAIGVTTQVTADDVGYAGQFADPNAQLHLLDSVQRTRTMQAMKQPVKHVAQAKLLAGVFDKPVPIRVVGESAKLLPEPTTGIAILPLQEAIRQSDRDEWVLGQSPDDGTLFRFNLGNSVHLGLVGATKSGKTSSTAYLLAYYALRNGMNLIALDGAGGVDWKPWADYAEVYDTNYINLPSYVGQINQLHNQRMDLVKQFGVATIDEVTSITTPHVLVIMEEFGYMMQALKGVDRKTYDQTESALSNLMRVSRKSGIHFLLIDQNPAKWPTTIVANIKQYVSYRVGGKVGSAINEYHLDDLKPVGQFSVDNSKYDAWYTKGELPKLLPDLRCSKVRYIKKVEPVVTSEPVTIEGVFSTKNDVDTPSEKTSYRTGYQSAEVVQTGSALVLSGSEVVQIGSQKTTYNQLIEQAVTSKKPLLAGAPVTEEDYELIYKVFLHAKSHNQAYHALWGGKNGKRQEWRDEAMAKFVEND